MNKKKDFLRAIVENDLQSGKYKEIVTRFPPEPNGFPHIGHAKSISINFGIARDYNGHCNLRMDDTNPTTEDTKYVRALEDAVDGLDLIGVSISILPLIIFLRFMSMRCNLFKWAKPMLIV